MNRSQLKSQTLLALGLFVSTLQAAPYMGVYLGPPVGGQVAGATILFITPNSPAAADGLQVGDIVKSVDGEEIADPLALVEKIRGRNVGDQVKLVVRRADADTEVAVTLKEMPQPAFPRPRRPRLGLMIQIPEQPGQLIVADVLPGSPAEKSEVKTGDVLTQVDGKPIEGYRQLVQVVQAKKAGEEIGLTIRRGEETIEKIIAMP